MNAAIKLIIKNILCHISYRRKSFKKKYQYKRQFILLFYSRLRLWLLFHNFACMNNAWNVATKWGVNLPSKKIISNFAIFCWLYHHFFLFYDISYMYAIHLIDGQVWNRNTSTNANFFYFLILGLDYGYSFIILHA